MRAVFLAIGIMVGLIFCVVIFKFANKDHKIKTEYDERQKALKGRGYMFGFYAMAIWEAVISVLTGVAEISLPLPAYVLHVAGIFVGITVVCIHAVWTGAYWGLNNDKSKYTIIFIALFVINALPVVMMFTSSVKVDFPYVNGACCLMLLAIGIASAVRKIVDKAEED